MNCLFSIQSSAIRSHQNINGLSIRLIFLIFCICMDNEWMMRWWWISCDERNSISGSHRTIKSTSLLAGCPYLLLYLTTSSPSMLLLWFGPRMWMSTCYAKLKCRSTHQHKALSIFPLKSSYSSCKRIWISIRQLRWPHNNTNVLAALFAWLQAIRTAEFISIEENFLQTRRATKQPTVGAYEDD